MKFNPNKHLKCVLDSHALELEEVQMRAYRQKRDEIEKALAQKFEGAIYRPLYSGSYAKHTGINSKFDIDLAVPFKRPVYPDPSRMYNDVHDFLKQYQFFNFPSISQVTKQRRSINLVFSLPDVELDMDIVPGLESGWESYPENHDLVLYDKIDHSTIKTNIHTHIDYIRGRQTHNTEKRREVIKLMKVWKKIYFKSLKSFLVELFVIDAYLARPHLYQKSLADRFLGVVDYISENIEGRTLVDPANQENNVSNTLNHFEKSNLKETLVQLGRRIRHDPSQLESLVPKNSKFTKACQAGQNR